MIRLALWLAGILGLTVVLHWLASQPGTVRIEWLGQILELSVFSAIVMAARPPFMSEEPRPRILPSFSSPLSGSNCQSLTGVHGIVSTCPLKRSDRAAGSPR